MLDPADEELLLCIKAHCGIIETVADVYADLAKFDIVKYVLDFLKGASAFFHFSPWIMMPMVRY